MPVLPELQSAFEGLAKMADQPQGLSTAEARAWLHGRIDEDFTSLYEHRPPVVAALRRAFGPP